jgi:thiamine biosynthesis lipoprotein
LSNTAIATSGDAYQSVTIDGRRYSHILDPRTGLGLSTSSSVTVIASDATTADALASAISVMGPLEGQKLIGRSRGVESLFVTRVGNRRTIYRSKGWPGRSTTRK